MDEEEKYEYKWPTQSQSINYRLIAVWDFVICIKYKVGGKYCFPTMGIGYVKGLSKTGFFRERDK